VQCVKVSSKTKETDTEDPRESSGNIGGANVIHGLVQLRKDIVDHFASSCVLVRRPLNVGLALQSFFVKRFANLGNLVAIVVVAIVVVVSIVIIIVSLA